MKMLNISFDGIVDSTGYLFSLAKCLSAIVKNSPYSELYEDIIASSGFAFRMWVDRESICPSATSIWSFDSQKPWVENGGLNCEHTGRYWGQEAIEEERRLHAIEQIKKSVDSGIGAVAWDISGCEWGIVTGYDDDKKLLSDLKITGEAGEVPYDKLGKLELPIMSVLTITGRSKKAQEHIIYDTMKLAVSHYKGEEWCENASGISAYPALIGYIQDKLKIEDSSSLEYYLGTYGALKYYAWKFFEKYDRPKLSELYKGVFTAWKSAFDLKKSKDATDPLVKNEIISLLNRAYKAENEALELMKEQL